MYAARGGEDTSALYPSEVVVTFNISASSTDDGKLHVEAAHGQHDQQSVGVGGETGASLNATRGNTVTVRFTHILFAPKDTLIQAATAKELQQKWNVIKGHATDDAWSQGVPTTYYYPWINTSPALGPTNTKPPID